MISYKNLFHQFIVYQIDLLEHREHRLEFDLPESRTEIELWRKTEKLLLRIYFLCEVFLESFFEFVGS